MVTTKKRRASKDVLHEARRQLEMIKRNEHNVTRSDHPEGQRRGVEAITTLLAELIEVADREDWLTSLDACVTVLEEAAPDSAMRERAMKKLRRLVKEAS